MTDEETAMRRIVAEETAMRRIVAEERRQARKHEQDGQGCALLSVGLLALAVTVVLAMWLG